MCAVKGSQTSLCHITSDPKFIFIAYANNQSCTRLLNSELRADGDSGDLLLI